MNLTAKGEKKTKSSRRYLGTECLYLLATCFSKTCVFPQLIHTTGAPGQFLPGLHWDVGIQGHDHPLEGQGLPLACQRCCGELLSVERWLRQRHQIPPKWSEHKWACQWVVLPIHELFQNNFHYFFFLNTVFGKHLILEIKNAWVTHWDRLSVWFIEFS